MTPSRPTPILSRRRFIQLAAATGVAGAAGAIGYGVECTRQPAPYPPSIAPDPTGTTLAPPNVPLLLAINTQAANSFASYFNEILRAEGLVAFRAARLEQLNLEYLSRFPVTLLSDGPLTPDQVVLLGAYVSAGGTLIAMRPDPRLAALMGVSYTGAQVSDGFLRIEPEHPVARGIAAEPLRFHGTADTIRLDGARAVAWLQSDADTPSADNPLITHNAVGDGTAVLWAFDLARSVALTRQGDPAHADQERDGLNGVRACDMFGGWIDLKRIRIPQADEQQRLLANLVSLAGPQPRLWYFPAGAGAMLVASGDSHESVAPFNDAILARVERYGGHMSIYYAPPVIDCARRIAREARWWASDLPVIGDAISEDYPLPTPKHVADWRARGHEFTMHPYVEAGAAPGYNAHWNDFVKYGYGPISPTVRTHRILWEGWVETARVQSMYGIRMNEDYYHVGDAFLGPDGRSVFGHFTGSGLPMKFIDEVGAILNVYQQNTQLVDEHLLDALGGRARLTTDEAITVSQQMIDDSLRHYPAALATQFHVDPFVAGGDQAANAGRWLDGTLEYAAARSVPIVTAERWLAFSEARHDAHVERWAWDAEAHRLTFVLSLPEALEGEIEVMIPRRYRDMSLGSVSINGAGATPGHRVVGGIAYAAFRVIAGRHTVQAQFA